MRAGTAFVSTDVETGKTECHLYLAAGGRIAVEIELGEDNWHLLHRAFDQTGISAAAHFEPRNVHVTPHGILLESFELLTTAVAS